MARSTLLLLSLLAACGVADETRERDQPGEADAAPAAADEARGADAATTAQAAQTARPVELTLSPRLSGRRLYIEGTATVPDGALIAFEVTPVDPGVETVEGTTAVRDSAFSEVVELTGWPPGEMEVWVAFQTILGSNGSQPDRVLELYGPMGKRVVGAQVQQVGTLRRVETARTIRLR
jgi:hypothetical protein